MLNAFTYEEYEHILRTLSSNCRESLTFQQTITESVPERFFLVRHDIDYDPDYALEMAEFEASIGIKATYFVLLSSEHYNLLSDTYTLFPRRLAELGHEVGLHYDVQTMAKRCGDVRDIKAMETILQQEIDILSSITGFPVRSIAMHNPSIYGEDPFANNTRYINAYAHQYIKDIAYFSDSCGAWRDSAYEAFTHHRLPDRLQLLIHPIFWHAQPGDRWDRLDMWMNKQCDTLKQKKQIIATTWNSHHGVKEHDRRINQIE